MPRIYRKMLFALILALLTTCLSTSLTFAQGGSWAIVSSPNQGTLGNQLFGVAALSSTSVWAVGYTSGRPLVEKWNGKHWTAVPSANVNTFDTFQAAATIPTSGDVWAVGEDFQIIHNASVHKTLVEQCIAC